MNHRERVVAAIHHRPCDRVPVDLGGMRSTGIMAAAYARLKEHLEIDEGDIFVFDATQQLAIVEEPVLQHFGCDVVILDAGALSPWRDYNLFDGTPERINARFTTESDGRGGEYGLGRTGRRILHRPADSYYFDSIYNPLMEAVSKEDLDKHEWPVYTDRALNRLQQEAKRLYDETDYAVLGSFGGAFLEGGQALRGWGNFMMDLAGDMDFAEELLERLLDNHLRNLDLYLDAVGDYIQIIQMGGDLGTQSGPQIGPEMYGQVIQPRQKALWGHIHDKAPEVSVFLHCCGGIYDLIPGIIDAGCDILNPVQINAEGMGPARLKQEFGDRLCFWGGGCDTQQVLPFAAPEEVYEHTRSNIEILKPGGGFVFTQVHNIQVDVPPENICAMYAAIKDNWGYTD
jgi:uroporphyrinogen decarboxylase